MLARRALTLAVCLATVDGSAAAAPVRSGARASTQRSTHKPPASARRTGRRASGRGAPTATHAKRTHQAAASPATSTLSEASVALPLLPPSLLLLATTDLVLSGAPSAAESFAMLPVVPPPAAASEERPLSAFSASAERLLSAVVDRARSQLGTRYVFGGSTPGQGLDCSSFARFAMEALGVRLPRTAAQQARLGAAVPRDRALLRPGDLLTFGRGTRVSHVGIYLGEGRFIHASVKSGRIVETTMERNGSLFKRWQGARRLIAGGDEQHAAAPRGDG